MYQFTRVFGQIDKFLKYLVMALNNYFYYSKIFYFNHFRYNITVI